MSIFATIISSWAFLSLTGKSFSADLQFLVTIASIPLVVVIVTRFVIPVFRERIKLSAYEYLERRFGLLARFYGNVSFILLHFFKMAMVLYLMCLAIEGATGWDLYLLIIIVGAATMVYTFFGGIEGVVWTDVTQGFLLLAGGIISLGYLLFNSGMPAGEVVSTAYHAGKLKLFNTSFDIRSVGIYVLLFYGFHMYMTKYATDQTVVQRYLLSSSTRNACRSLWISVFFLGVVWLIFMSVGVLLWVFYAVKPGLLPDAVRSRPDQVFAYFIGNQLPPGITGLILAGLFAASMSTLSSDLNSLSSVLVDDFYNKLKKQCTDKQRLVFSRFSVLVTGVMAILLAMSLTKIKSMVDAFFVVTSVVAGGMVGMFFLGLFTRRCSKRGLYVGLLFGIVFIVWATLTNPENMANSTLNWLPKLRVNILWLGLIGNVIVFLVGLLASLIITPGYMAEGKLTVYGIIKD
jgi:SSS family solute:Na+ symporter